MIFPQLYKHSKRKNRTIAENDQWISEVMHDFMVPLLDEFV
jgi:hypothetical protein